MRELKAEERLLMEKVMRRCEMRRLYRMPLKNPARMGAFAAALAGEGDRLVCVTLNSRYYPISHSVLQDGGGVPGIAFRDEIAAMCRRDKASLVMLCVSHHVSVEETLAFSDLYQMLLADGIRVVDLFQVNGYAYYSILAEYDSCSYPEDGKR